MREFRTRIGARLHKQKPTATLVSRARSLLAQAITNAKRPARKKRIRKARNTLPKR